MATRPGTTTRTERTAGRGRRIPLALAAVATIPGSLLGAAALLRPGGAELAPPLAATLYGLAVIGAAFLLGWAAEAAQLDVSASLAIGALALVAVLPEYAVSFVFAWKGGNDVERFGAACKPPGGGESNCSLVLANMTGANRLLIGIGWALVVFVAWWRWRRRGEPREGITLGRSKSVELSFLTLACAYSLTLPLKRTITLLDAVVLVAIFVAYTLRISKAPAEEPHLIGPAAWVGGLSRRARRTAVVALFSFAAAVILLVAEHFAEALVDTGTELGISEFFLVQWLAPLASEAPELLVAGLYAWQLKTGEALTTLVSSKVNQWTLLVGTLPLVFAVASSSLHGLPIEAAQREELLLTAAQTVFAVAVLVNLSMSLKEAGAIFALFWAQFIIGALVPPSLHGVELVGLSAVYLLLGVALLVRHRSDFRTRLREGFRTPYDRLGEPAAAREGPPA
ncbi:MAG TPA: sodium:proton exchanger [Actinomycetota bacterium]|nr:sodium:proton exchanger [Actinomycetota bacterium]